MRLLFIIGLSSLILLGIMNSCASEKSNYKADDMSVYLADYDGKPGSTMVDLTLKKNAPFQHFPFVLICGPSYTGGKDGLPHPDDLTRLYSLTEKFRLKLSEEFDFRYAGTLSFENSRTDYLYVKDTVGLREKVLEIYNNDFNEKDIYLNIKSDQEWAAYLEFLYPNQATIDHYNLLVE